MVDVHDLQSDRRSRQREERLRALMDQSDCDVLSGQTVPLVPGPRSGEQRVPMYFSNMARGTSESRVSMVETVGMDAPGVAATNTQAACVFEAVQQRDDVGRD